MIEPWEDSDMEFADPVKEAAARVGAFLEERKKMTGMDPELLYSLHGREYELRVRDLELLVDVARATQAVVEDDEAWDPWKVSTASDGLPMISATRNPAAREKLRIIADARIPKGSFVVIDGAGTAWAVDLPDNSD